MTGVTLTLEQMALSTMLTKDGFERNSAVAKEFGAWFNPKDVSELVVKNILLRTLLMETSQHLEHVGDGNPALTEQLKLEAKVFAAAFLEEDAEDTATIAKLGPEFIDFLNEGKYTNGEVRQAALIVVLSINRAVLRRARGMQLEQASGEH